MKNNKNNVSLILSIEDIAALYIDTTRFLNVNGTTTTSTKVHKDNIYLKIDSEDNNCLDIKISLNDAACQLGFNSYKILEVAHFNVYDGVVQRDMSNTDTRVVFWNE